nr:2-dehydropantoate 2-reductase N-terminal domain-containing protein [Streptomyces pactum]
MFGAGSIGCHLGGRLAPFADVTLIGRPAAMEALRKHGLVVSGGGRPVTRVDPAAVRLSTSAEAATDADHVLVTVKSAATREAARQLAPHLAPGAVVVSFQNGLRNPEVLRAGLRDRDGAEADAGTRGPGTGTVTGPGRPAAGAAEPAAGEAAADRRRAPRVLAGMVPYNVVQTAPGRFHQGTAGVLMIDDDPAGAPLTALLARAGLRVEARPDMREIQHAKLLMNLNNAINALSGLPLRDQLGRRPYRFCLALCQREALAAYRAAEVRPARLGALPALWMPRLLRLPDPVFRRLAAATLAIDAEARSSMWEDLRRGRPTEIDSLQGEIVSLAEQHGLRAPVNARLVTLVRQAEAAGPEAARTWSGPELLAELSAARVPTGPVPD